MKIFYCLIDKIDNDVKKRLSWLVRLSNVNYFSWLV